MNDVRQKKNGVLGTVIFCKMNDVSISVHLLRNVFLKSYMFCKMNGVFISVQFKGMRFWMCNNWTAFVPAPKSIAGLLPALSMVTVMGLWLWCAPFEQQQPQLLQQSAAAQASHSPIVQRRGILTPSPSFTSSGGCGFFKHSSTEHRTILLHTYQQKMHLFP